MLSVIEKIAYMISIYNHNTQFSLQFVSFKTKFYFTMPLPGDDSSKTTQNSSNAATNNINILQRCKNTCNSA